jgi:hypothetical protein
MQQDASDECYEEAEGRPDNNRSQPISARDAHRRWTAAMRASENAISEKLVDKDLGARPSLLYFIYEVKS